MFQHDNLPNATAMANNSLAANTARYRVRLIPRNLSISREVCL